MKHLTIFDALSQFLSKRGELRRSHVSLTTDNSEVHYVKDFDANGYSFVDLGLPSGTLWATANVGATEETEYGGLYQWGGTLEMTNETAAWVNYVHGTGDNAITKYVMEPERGIPDGKKELDLEDDIAHLEMGGGWRLPSKEQIQELLDGTTNSWVTDYEGSGVNGLLMVSVVDTSRHLFFPASGYKNVNSLGARGAAVGVWSRSLNNGELGFPGNWNTNAYSLAADETATRLYRNVRFAGFSARGVL